MFQRTDARLAMCADIYCLEDLKHPDYRKIQPLGQVPALQYGDISIWEPGAILEFPCTKLPKALGLLLNTSTAWNYAEYLQVFLSRDFFHDRSCYYLSQCISFCYGPRAQCVLLWLQFFHFGEVLGRPVCEVVAHTIDLPTSDRLPQVAKAAEGGLVRLS